MNYRHYTAFFTLAFIMAFPAFSQSKLSFQALENNNEVYYYKGKPFTGISVENFPNNKKMQEITWVDGKLNGLKTEYFSDGRIRAKITMADNHKNGPFVYYFTTGKEKQTGMYHDDLLNDTVKDWDFKGKLVSIIHYTDEVKTGKAIYYHDNGKIAQIIFYKDGIPDGNMKSFYAAGNIRNEGTYKMGMREGLFRSYHQTGGVADESFYKDGIIDSVSTFWDNVAGDRLKQEYYKLGVKEGEWVTFGLKGDTQNVVTYSNGILNGPYKKYVPVNFNKAQPFDMEHPNGDFHMLLDEYGFYKDGKIDGKFATGLIEREKHVEGQFDDGIKTGIWYYYNKENKVVLEVSYDETGKVMKVKSRRKFLFIPYYHSETEFDEPEE
ncbi:MAG: hypothetical protein H7321_04060 [Bacteroidia bacterium]|nr:hypothetical protein [Bacteroidia bacterium]